MTYDPQDIRHSELYEIDRLMLTPARVMIPRRSDW
jgi:hypothetical protein